MWGVLVVLLLNARMRAYTQLFFYSFIFWFQSSNCRARVLCCVVYMLLLRLHNFHRTRVSMLCHNSITFFVVVFSCVVLCISFHFNNLIVRLLKRKRRNERKWARDVDCWTRCVFAALFTSIFHCIRASIIELNVQLKRTNQRNKRDTTDALRPNT